MMVTKRKSVKKKTARRSTGKRTAVKKRTAKKSTAKRPSRKKKVLKKKKALKKKTTRKRTQRKVAKRKVKRPARKKKPTPKKKARKTAARKKPTKKKTTKAKKATRAAKKPLKRTKPIKPAPEPQEPVSASMGFEELISRTIDDRKLDTTTDPGSLFGIAPGHAPTTDEPLERTETDRLRFLTVDPGFAFAYWEVTPGSMLKAAQRLGRDAKLTLRFREAATGLIENPAAWDVEVFDRLGNWYLKLDTPDQHLDVEIGVKSPTGEFIPISTAERLQLTKEMLSRPGPMKWIANGEYIDADPESLKQILGPYFYELLVRGRFETIIGSSVEAIFHSIDALKMGGHS